MENYVEMSQYFTDKGRFFILSAAKLERVQEFKIKLFK